MVFKSNLRRVAKAFSPSTPVPPTTVADVMTREVVTLNSEQTFGEAMAMLANRPFRHFLVIDPNSKLAGVISDRDMLRVMGNTTDWKTKKIADVMTRDVYTVSPETPLSTAVHEIVAHRINCLPVLDRDEKVCGIITSTDLLGAFEKLQSSLERVSS
jgi:CBS domain-containing protein